MQPTNPGQRNPNMNPSQNPNKNPMPGQQKGMPGQQKTGKEKWNQSLNK